MNSETKIDVNENADPTADIGGNDPGTGGGVPEVGDEQPAKAEAATGKPDSADPAENSPETNEDALDKELKTGAAGNTGAVAHTGNRAPDTGKKQTAVAPPPVKSGFVDPAKKRREKIKKLEARLQREIALDNTATRKERNGQLFVWGAMVESIYRDGNAQERGQLRRWAKQKLTEKRHLQRAENGFARIEDEAAEKTDA